MSAFLAIVADTWRQSRQQGVFLVMLGLLGILAIAGIGIIQVHEEDDAESRLGLVVVQQDNEGLEYFWRLQYAATLVRQDGERFNQFSPQAIEGLSNRLVEVDRLARDIPRLRKGLEFYLMTLAGLVFTISMSLFVAACSPYFPDLLAAGAIDVVVARPLARWKIFLGKFAGGLVLFTAAITATYLVVLTGLGLRTGEYCWRLLSVIPLQVGAAALLYAWIALIGIRWRSTGLAMVVGYTFYFVIDLVFQLLVTAQASGFFEGYPRWDRSLEWASRLLPNFGFIKENAVASVLNMPALAPLPLIVAGVWLGIGLALGALAFQRRDF